METEGLLVIGVGDFEGRDLLVDMDDFYDRIKKGKLKQTDTINNYLNKMIPFSS